MLNDDINLNLAIFAFPFTSLDMLFNDCFEEYYIKGSVGIEDKVVVREKLVKYLKNKYYLSSYDEAYLFLDKWYLYPRRDKICLNEMVRLYISIGKMKMMPKFWEVSQRVIRFICFIV